MSMLHGVKIIIHVKREIGRDPLNMPIYEYSKEYVENVLIMPIATSDTSGESDYSECQIAIPKGDQHEWRNTFVEFFGKKWRTVGKPLEGIEAMLPLDWHKKVTVRCDE